LAAGTLPPCSPAPGGRFGWLHFWSGKRSAGMRDSEHPLLRILRPIRRHTCGTPLQPACHPFYGFRQRYSGLRRYFLSAPTAKRADYGKDVSLRRCVYRRTPRPTLAAVQQVKRIQASLWLNGIHGHLGTAESPHPPQPSAHSPTRLVGGYTGCRFSSISIVAAFQARFIFNVVE
jgi:hypothetical protein